MGWLVCDDCRINSFGDSTNFDEFYKNIGQSNEDDAQSKQDAEQSAQ